MRNFIEKFSRNAGKIWVALNEHGELSETELMKNTGLTENDFYAAVGWLARENKICKYGTLYMLGETNLTGEIGIGAGKMWKALETWGEIDISAITRLAEIEERDAYSALGWLAREDKIQTKERKTKELQIKKRFLDLRHQPKTLSNIFCLK